MEACAKSLGYICEQARHCPVSPEMAIPFQVPSEALKGVQRSCGHWSIDQSQTPACADVEAFQVNNIVKKKKLERLGN